VAEKVLFHPFVKKLLMGTEHVQNISMKRWLIEISKYKVLHPR
jgi:hypothetical protein